jgi:site-specific recombinase XerD
MVQTVEDRFEAMLRLEQKSIETIRTYQKAVRKFLIFLEVHDLPLAGASVVPFFSMMNEEEHAKPSTMRLYIISLKRYFDFLREQEHMDISFPKMKYPTVHRNKPKFLDKADFQRLYTGTWGDPQLRAMVSTTYATAMRVSEICNSKVGDYNLGKTPSVLVSGKTPEETDAVLPLTATAVADIKAYLKDVKERTGYRPGKDAYMFFQEDDVKQNVYPRMMNEKLYRVCDSLGMERVSWHWIRHSRATHLREDDTAMADIQDLLRHRSPATTAIYAHTDTEKLRKKVNRTDILGARKDEPEDEDEDGEDEEEGEGDDE